MFLSDTLLCTAATMMYYRDTLSDTNLADLGIIMSQIRRKARFQQLLTLPCVSLLTFSIMHSNYCSQDCSC
jgi:hypothetical protein